MDLFKHTIYINLATREDRQKHVICELAKLGISGIRMDAVKTSSGAIGCSISHIKCLEMAKQQKFPQVFICEDDITFLQPEFLLENIEKVKENKNLNWDVILVGGNNCPPYEILTDYCIRVKNNQTATGYIVKSHYYDILINNFRKGLSQLLKEPENKQQYALDIYWKQLQQTGFWIMMIPPSVIQYATYSDIENRNVNYERLMLDLDKKWLRQVN